MPRRFAGGVSPVTVVDLVFTQNLIRDIRAQIESAPGTPIFGAIVGAVFEDPTCARRWARLDRGVPSAAPVAEDCPVDALSEALGQLRAGLDGETVLGWYRSHHQAGLYLSPEEARFHEERFPEAWGAGVILAGAGDRLAGGVFQRTDPEGLSRSVYTPFYELVESAEQGPSGARQTFVSWANYQTDARVMRADDTNVPITVATIKELAQPSGEPAADSIASEAEAVPIRRQRMNPSIDGLPFLESPPKSTEQVAADSAAAAEEKRSAEEHEAEWDKVQIQRSLTAVGRSLGPSTIGQLGAPAPAEPADETTREEPPTGRPSLTVIDGAGEPDDSTGGSENSWPDKVIPIGSGSGAGVALVGGARRRKQRLPVAKIAAGAAGVILMGVAGWIGTRSLGNEGSPGESVAGLSIAPNGLFGRGDDVVDDATADADSPTSDTLPTPAESTEGPAVVGLPESGRDHESPTESTDVSEQIEGLARLAVTVDPNESYETAEETGAYQGVGAPPLPSPTTPQVVEAPTLDSLVIVDPSLSAYQNALSIFRTETDRYEETRREYDDGLITCNPLNLAYRGVLDSADRLDRRYTDVETALLDAEQRVHQTALRQFAVARTHYELTDCPMPVGG